MKVFGRTPVNLHAALIPRGQLFLIPKRCKGCRLCVHFCPRQVLQESSRTNAKGYHYPEIRAGKEQACIHCEFCTIVCPEFAIYSVEVGV